MQQHMQFNEPGSSLRQLNLFNLGMPVASVISRAVHPEQGNLCDKLRMPTPMFAFDGPLGRFAYGMHPKNLPLLLGWVPHVSSFTRRLVSLLVALRDLPIISVLTCIACTTAWPLLLIIRSIRTTDLILHVSLVQDDCSNCMDLL